MKNCEAIDGCNWFKKYDYHADTKEVIDMAIKALEEQDKHRWIPGSASMDATARTVCGGEE